MSNSLKYSRPQTGELVQRLHEPRRFIQVVAGSRQVGKTTLAGQAAHRSGLPTRHASADEPTLRDTQWIEQQWEAARNLADEADANGALLVLDEVQKVTGWSEAVKPPWPTISICSPAPAWSPDSRSTPEASPGGGRRAPSSRSSTRR